MKSTFLFPNKSKKVQDLPNVEHKFSTDSFNEELKDLKILTESLNTINKSLQVLIIIHLLTFYKRFFQITPN